RGDLPERVEREVFRRPPLAAVDVDDADVDGEPEVPPRRQHLPPVRGERRRVEGRHPGGIQNARMMPAPTAASTSAGGIAPIAVHQRMRQNGTPATPAATFRNALEIGTQRPTMRTAGWPIGKRERRPGRRASARSTS